MLTGPAFVSVKPANSQTTGGRPEAVAVEVAGAASRLKMDRTAPVSAKGMMGTISFLTLRRSRRRRRSLPRPRL